LPQEYDAFAFNNRLTGDLLANFNKSFHNLSVKAILGATTFDETARRVSMGASSLVIPNFYNISNRVGERGLNEKLNQYTKTGAFG
jgi:hypothetical protein